MKVALVVDVENLGDKQIFESHLLKEGFSRIKGEDFAYVGKAVSHLFNTRTYILEVVSKGLKKTSFDHCRIIFEIGDNPMEIFLFDKSKNEFLEFKT